METIKENDYIIIFTAGKKYCVKVVPDKNFSTKTGTIKLKDLIGKPFGIEFENHFIFKPTIDDIILLGLKRETQIVYPKENFYIGFKLGLKNGMKVFECGTGSGALTITLSIMVAPDGYVHTYEKEEKFYKRALKNIEKFGYKENVKIFLKDISDGIDETDFDAAFLDVKEPWLYIDIVYKILKPSAVLGIIVPTTNQISKILPCFTDKFADIEVMEFLQRFYKINPDRIRPEDRMVAHTGYLVFARKFLKI